MTTGRPMRLLIAALLAASAGGSALAGGTGGVWTCNDAAGAPVVTIEIQRGGDHGHRYIATALIEMAEPLTGTGDLKPGSAPDGGSAYVAANGSLYELDLWATHRGYTLYWTSGQETEPFLACRR